MLENIIDYRCVYVTFVAHRVVTGVLVVGAFEMW